MVRADLVTLKKYMDDNDVKLQPLPLISVHSSYFYFPTHNLFPFSVALEDSDAAKEIKNGIMSVIDIHTIPLVNFGNVDDLHFTIYAEDSLQNYFCYSEDKLHMFEAGIDAKLARMYQDYDCIIALTSNATLIINNVTLDNSLTLSKLPPLDAADFDLSMQARVRSQIVCGRRYESLGGSTQQT
jgi:hypothetical protein